MNKVLIKGNSLYPPPIKLELLCGIPGAGKSTYAAQFPEALVLNRDTYRELLTGFIREKYLQDGHIKVAFLSFDLMDEKRIYDILKPEGNDLVRGNFYHQYKKNKPINHG